MSWASRASPAAGGSRTTIVDKGATAASDHVDRDFNPPAPNVMWCGDITYLHTGEGWLYLATVIDLFSRRVIGWAAADHMRTELVADALDDGGRDPRRPRRRRGVPQRPRVGLHVDGPSVSCATPTASCSRWARPGCAGTTRSPRAGSGR